MPEGVAAYPRWRGELSEGPAFPAIAAQELRRAWRSTWVQLAVVFFGFLAALYINSLFSAKQVRGDSVHTMAYFLQFLHVVSWLSLAIVAIAAGPALIDDKRRGALELYLSRAVRIHDYLAGKALAVFALALLGVLLPGLVYVLGTHLVFEQQPEHWNLVPAGLLVYALMWGGMVTGLGLGLSASTRNSRAATIILLGAFGVADILVTNILEGISRNGEFQVLSPFKALLQQSGWLFGTPGEYAFPEWWGLAAWALLLLTGWGLVVWKRPRVAGGA